MNTKTAKTPLEQVVAKVGSKYRLAKLLKMTPQGIQGWQERGQIPVEHVLRVEEVSGVPRHVLRPDIYPPKDYKALRASQAASGA